MRENREYDSQGGFPDFNVLGKYGIDHENDLIYDFRDFPENDQEFTLVVKFAVSYQKWHFGLENENFEISRDSV